MNLSPADLGELTELALHAATEAGRMIAQSRPADIQHKPGTDSLASQVVTEIDRRSEHIILDIVGPTLERFELGLLTEERDDDQSRLAADHFWSIDPLDGTLPFIDGTPGYAVSIALVSRDGTPQLGVVYDPVENTLFSAVAGGGAFRNGYPLATDAALSSDVLSVFADRSFVDQDDHDAVVDELSEVARSMGLSGVRFHTTSGAVMNACGVLTNAPACYVKRPKPTGGGSLWDFAATACLFNEAGAIATDISGNRLDLNRADSTSMNHRGVLFATGEQLARQLRAMSRPD